MINGNRDCEEELFKVNSEKDFYESLFWQLHNVLNTQDRESFINRNGIYFEGQFIDIINPLYNNDFRNEYIIKGELTKDDDKWIIEYKDQFYDIEDIKFYD